MKPPSNAELYDFGGQVPPWPSYCRACIRRAGLDPYTTKECDEVATCEHYSFKWRYQSKPKGIK